MLFPKVRLVAGSACVGNPSPITTFVYSLLRAQIRYPGYHHLRVDRSSVTNQAAIRSQKPDTRFPLRNCQDAILAEGKPDIAEYQGETDSPPEGDGQRKAAKNAEQ